MAGGIGPYWPGPRLYACQGVRICYGDDIPGSGPAPAEACGYAELGGFVDSKRSNGSIGPSVPNWVTVLGSPNGILGVLADQAAKKNPPEMSPS